MITGPDGTYFQTREQLLPHEDLLFKSMVNRVPDFYTNKTSMDISGVILRAMAMEIARVSHWITVSTNNASPANMHPLDLLRTFKDPLYLQSEPLSAYTDTSNRERILALLEAFRKGATSTAIGEILGTISNGPVDVVESYTKTDGSMAPNSIQVTVGSSVETLQTLTGEMQVGLNLSKPAHIGLSLNTLFVETEILTNYIQDELYNDEDHLISPSVTTQWVEEAPEPDYLHLHNTDGSLADGVPDTRLAPTSIAYTLANILLEGLDIRVGGSWTQPLIEGTTVKVAAQTDPSDNGYYTAKAGAWVRYNPAESKFYPATQKVWEVQDEGPFILDME